MLSQQSQDGLRHLAPGAADANRGNSRGGWFRVGLLAAAISAPILARWNDLRGRARLDTFESLREEAETRLSDLGANLEAGLENARALIASGEPRAREALESVAATASAMQEFAQSAAQKVSVGLGDFNENVADFVEKQHKRLNKGVTGKRRQQVNMALWLAGIGVGVAVAGVGAYVLIRRRLEHVAEEEALLDAPLHDVGAHPSVQGDGRADFAASGGTAAQGAESASGSTAPAATFRPPLPEELRQQNGEAEERATPRAGDEERPAYIGNIHTLIYHDANSGNLPALENQVYFRDEAQAQAAGFHRDRSESTATTVEDLSQHMAVVSTEPSREHEPISPDFTEAAETATTHEPGVRTDAMEPISTDDELDEDGEPEDQADTVTMDDELL